MTQAPAAAADQRRGTFQRAWTLFTLRGVPIRVHWSGLVIVALVVWFAYRPISQRLAVQAPALPDWVAPASAIAVAALFFASLLAHELGHAFTSLDRGIPVASITMFMLGAVTESTREPVRPRHEFVIVGIGPFTSFVLAALFGLIHTAVEAQQPYALVAGYVAWVNLLLALFNVVPGYPLDGGRLLRSVIWAVVGSPHRATRWAARVGQVFALALIGFGVWVLTRSGMDGLGGWWEILIGAFLMKGAMDARRRARFHEGLAGRAVADAMGPAPPTLDPRLTLREAIEHVQTRPTHLWPVGDPLVGVVRLADIDRVPAGRWDEVALDAVASDASSLLVDADAPLGEVVHRLAEAPGEILLVTRAGQPVGLLSSMALLGRS